MILKNKITQDDYIALLKAEIVFDYNNTDYNDTEDYIKPCNIFIKIQSLLLSKGKLELMFYHDDLDKNIYVTSINEDYNLYVFHRDLDEFGVQLNQLEKEIRKNYHCWHFIMNGTFNTYVMGLKL